LLATKSLFQKKGEIVNTQISILRLSKRAVSFFSALAAIGLLASAAAAETKFGAMKVLSEANEGFVREMRFDIVVAGEVVPAILWTPQGAEGTRPLVLFGHGGRVHKRVDNILRSARDLVITEHYAVLAIDGPGHGDRTRSPAPAEGAPPPSTNMTAEWQAAIDAVQKLDYVGKGPIAYWGVSMGTRYGIPLVANEPRIVAAVLGLYGLFEEGRTVPKGFGDDVRKIKVPLIFVFQRSDTLMTLQNGIDLYDAFGSKEKAMHVNPGGHTGIPVSEQHKWKPFFVNHLGKAKLK
jgi:dienelactone hydrolase